MPEPKKRLNQKKKTKKPQYTFAVGRRKTARARIRLYPRPGPILVNDRPIEQYFPLPIQKMIYSQPFRLTETSDRYSATVKVEGSGKSGQLGAVVHGFARALSAIEGENYRQILKKHGFLTRDSRMKERRKPGLAQAARARKQSPKR